jgi:hypothetical protein
MSLYDDALIDVTIEGRVEQHALGHIRPLVAPAGLRPKVGVHLVEVRALEGLAPVCRAVRMPVNLVSITVRRF